MAKKLTVLHVVISLETGGLEKFVLDLIKNTGAEFHHRILCLERPGELSASVVSGVDCLHLPPGLCGRALFDIRALIRKHRVDLVHTHNEKAQFYGSLAALFCSVPTLHTKHGKNNEDFKSRLRNALMARLCRRVVAVSHDAALQCTHREMIPASRVTTVLNGIDTELFRPRGDVAAFRREIGAARATVVIGIVGRLVPVKDHATLLAACRLLKENDIPFRLVVVGDGPLRHALARRAEELCIASEVHFTGMRKDIPELMNGFDIFALSSLSEGVSLTLLEAMSCSLPVVATGVGGTPEVVVDGETGFLVPPLNPQAIARRLTLLAQNPSLRSEMGGKGRQRVVEQFGICQAARNYAGLYRSLCGR